MTTLERRRLFAKICYKVSEMMPDNMTDNEFFLMYSQLATHFSNEVNRHLSELVETEEKEDEEEKEIDENEE